MKARARKSQSAMEYLMTYGWAILIIAVILGVLFQLGVFSSSNFTARAQPGACQVTRVGTGLTQTVSLNGECQGLTPEYVSSFTNAVPTNSFVLVPSTAASAYAVTGPITITAWIDPTSLPASGQIEQIAEEHSYFYFQLTSTGLKFTDDNAHYVQTGTVNIIKNLNHWVFVAAEVTGGSGTTMSASNSFIYVNGTSQGTTYNGAWSPPASGTAWMDIGGCGSCSPISAFFGGYIANMQIYNISLSSAELQALYLEGIGGAPVRPQNTTYWAPLNGNLNDYSGFSAQGTGSDITYSSSWISTYTPP